MKSKHAHLEHTKHSAVRSEHFKEEDYTNRFADDLVRRLKRDEIGICVFPSKHACCVSSHQAADKPESERSKRNVRYFSASQSLPVIFCSFTLAKTSLFSCKCNNCDLSSMESLVISLSRSVRGRVRNYPLLLHYCCPYKKEPEQAVEAIYISGSVEASEGVSSCPMVGFNQWQLF